MTAQQPYAGDPWATGLPPESRALTRDDLIEAAARTLIGVPADYQWTEDDLAPLSSIDDQGVVGVWRSVARTALDATYPQVSTDDELDELPVGTVIVNELGRVYRCALPGGLGQAGGMVVGTLEVWEQPGAWEVGRKVRRVTSATLALSGPWTVVWTRVAA